VQHGAILSGDREALRHRVVKFFRKTADGIAGGEIRTEHLPRLTAAGVCGGGAYDGTLSGTIGRLLAMRMLPLSCRLPHTQ